MKEFGSDFHYLPIQKSEGKTISDYFPNAVYFACGRQALINLYQQNGWSCLWVPDYFCYSVLSSLKREDLNLKFYQDSPFNDERETIHSLPFEEGDALLRVNYFGLRSKRTNIDVPVPVIEDHTHDLIGDWAVKSDADWCIASLRKTLPIAEGGILWSPKGKRIDSIPQATELNDRVASLRWNAMKMKAFYLDDKISDKDEFRTSFLQTEELFDTMPVSSLDRATMDYLRHIDIQSWYQRKRDNWTYLKNNLHVDIFTVLEPEEKGCNPFSLTLLFNDGKTRDRYRTELIKNDVYPAVLWNIPSSNKYSSVTDFSKKMLSIHCDARYIIEDVERLYDIIVGC